MLVYPAVMALPRDPRWTASNHIPESLHGTSPKASCLFAKHPSGSRCQSPEGNEHPLLFPLRWEVGIIPVTQIRKLSPIRGVRMKSVLFWKLLFLHYMCLSENQRMQGNIEDHHSQSPPPPKQRPRNILTSTWTWATIPRQLILLWDSALCSDVYAFAGAVLGKSQRMTGDQGLEQKSCQGNWRCQNLRVKLWEGAIWKFDWSGCLSFSLC